MLVFFLIFSILTSFSFGQNFLSSDPFYLLYEEKNNIDLDSSFFQAMFRPQLKNIDNTWHLIMRNELFYNDGAPNLENMSNRFIGNGFGVYNGINLSYSGKFISFSFEPFYYKNQNRFVDNLNREDIFSYLNDVQNRKKTPYTSFGFRESQFYFTYEGISLGLSNANMWWGPGLHTSLSMTNNTVGFPYLIIGTLSEKRHNNIGYNMRYIFTQIDQTKNSSYYTAFVARASIYKNPIITIGLNRNILSPFELHGVKISKLDAANIFSVESEILENSYQTLIGYFILDFPTSRLKVFIELGTTDKWNNINDFINYPDHGIGSIIGIRQYGPFSNSNLVIGLEYARLVQSSLWDKRPSPNWYGNSIFDYSSYDNRRWAAHSGSDSDDLYIYFGYQNNKFYFMPALNFERHGVLYSRPAEVKMEIRLDFRYKWKDYWFNIYFEREWLEHAGFIVNKWRIGNVLWFGIERDLSNMLSDKIRLINK